ncbi:MAG: hypothetical protein IJO24_05190 [Clostridia bacterium]|nr:hypothetical protein [Clostridia bacterium]
MANKEKGLNTKLYAVIVFFGILAALVLITFTTFKSRYTAFHPDEVARSYVDTIVQTGDGYNAYKNALISKNYKYGDYIREYFIYPVIYRDTDYQPGADRGELKGYNDDEYIGEKTANDDGSLSGEFIAEMYKIYELLIDEYGWDNYDNIFRSYFNALVTIREQYFGDKYMTDEIMFTTLESNVRTYGEALTGTEEEFDENTGVQISEKATGRYQAKYGEDYKFTTTIKSENEIDAKLHIGLMNEDKLAKYKVSKEEIKDVKSYTVQVTDEDGTVVVENDITVVKIGQSWYVDDTTADMRALYLFYR